MTKFLVIAIGCFILANCARDTRESGGELVDEKTQAPQFRAQRPGKATVPYRRASADSCDAKNCPLGCCNEAGECSSYVRQTKLKCGTGGETCAQCPRDALSCTVGHCVVDESCLDYCNDGCCTELGECIPFGAQSPGECGAAASCSACGTQQQCAEGECTPDAVWLITIRRVKIADKKADGQTWDTSQAGSRLPDPYVQSGLNSSSVPFPEGETQPVEDTLLPTWSAELQSGYFHTERSLLKNGLRFRIRDSDVGADDTISECASSVLLADLATGSTTISSCGISSLATDLRVNFRSQRKM